MADAQHEFRGWQGRLASIVRCWLPNIELFGRIMLNDTPNHLYTPMSRRTRHQDRLLKEQDTVGMQRAERRELEEMASRKKVEASRVRAQRGLSLEHKPEEADTRPQRIARAGKPLKRP